jgi:MFS family permease
MLSPAVKKAAWFFVIGTTITSLDRSSIAPLLLGMSREFGTGIATIAAGSSFYFLAYGLSQPIWGRWSDRLGRIKVIQVSLVIGGVADLICLLHLPLEVFFVVRAIAGFGMAAAFPSSLIYLSDAISNERERQPIITHLTAGVAVGLVGGTVLGGLFVETIGWRWIFGLVGVLALILAYTIRVIPNVMPVANKFSIFQTFRLIFQDKWTSILYTLVLIEGTVLLGAFALTVPAYEQVIKSASISGLVTSIYGFSVLGVSLFVSKVSKNWSAIKLFSIGGASAVIGYVLLAYDVNTLTVAISVIFQGLAWVFFHTTLQAWITSIKSPVKSSMIPLFAAFLFFGSALGSTISGVALERYGTFILFSASTVIAIIMWILGVYWRNKYNKIAQVN